MAYNENGDLSEETFEHEQREYTIDDHGRLVEGPAGASVSRSEARFR